MVYYVQWCTEGTNGDLAALWTGGFELVNIEVI